MKHFLFNIANKYARWTLSIWTILFLFELLISKYASFEFNLFGTLFGFGLVVFISATMMNQTQWPIFWRRTSETIRQFWAGIFALLIFNLALNGLCWLIFKTYKGTTVSLFETTPLDICWAIILVFTFSLVMLFNQRVMMANNALKPARQVLLLAGFYVWLIIIVPLLVYSRLFAYGFAAVFLIGVFLFNNSFILGSIRLRTRIRNFCIATASILILMGVSYELEILKSSEPSTFLGRIGPKKPWFFSDLEKIDKPSVWIDWKNNWFSTTTDRKPEQMDQALAKLESICPVLPTDSPAVVECIEKNAETTSTVIYGKTEEPLILARLNSSSFYVRLLGILSARQLEHLSPEIKGKLEEMSRSVGRLNSVAEVTLAYHNKDNKAGLRIVVRAEK